MLGFPPNKDKFSHLLNRLESLSAHFSKVLQSQNTSVQQSQPPVSGNNGYSAGNQATFNGYQRNHDQYPKYKRQQGYQGNRGNYSGNKQYNNWNRNFRTGQNQQYSNNHQQNNNFRSNVVTCFNCNEKGHIRPKCPKLQGTVNQVGGNAGPKALMGPLY